MGMHELTALRDGTLKGAWTLDLSGCDLLDVPPEVFELGETLEVLDLGRNAIGTLPAEFARLTKLRVLFCSGNAFDRLPPVLGACPMLSQIGFRGCGLREVPDESLPPTLRWLILTDNKLEMLPLALGERPTLQKLMLAGNALRTLPASLAGAPSLELIRIAANRLETLPGWLLELPRLAWLAFAGNPVEAGEPSTSVVEVQWSRLRLGPLLGEGASGQIYQARWPTEEGAEDRPVAVKLFRGVMTSDGLPAREMAACLAAGDHPNLIGSLGQVTGHPQGLDGLVMRLLPSSWRTLAAPPSQASCTRDVYPQDRRFDTGVALRAARGIAAACAHLHARGLMHGDLYAHNLLWDGHRGEALMSDFGAASFMPSEQSAALTPLDVLAFGVLLGELVERCDGGPVPAAVIALQQACVRSRPSERPHMTEVLEALRQEQNVVQ